MRMGFLGIFGDMFLKIYSERNTTICFLEGFYWHYVVHLLG